MCTVTLSRPKLVVADSEHGYLPNDCVIQARTFSMHTVYDYYNTLCTYRKQVVIIIQQKAKVEAIP